MSSNKTLILIVFLILSLIASIFLIFRTAIFMGKATSTNSSLVSIENSYLFASPLQAKADDQESIRVTIFLLDGRGLGVSNQLIDLIVPKNLTIQNQQPITDSAGKSTFDLSSSLPGKFEISAKTNNQTIPQKVTIVFN